MKKVFATLLSAALVLSLAACGNTNETETTTSTETSVEATSTETTSTEAASTEASVETTGAIEVAPMTYAEYDAADLDTPVVVTMYVQDHQSWWDNKISVYGADKDGAYFVYNMECSEEDAAKLVPGTKIFVTGTKTAWAGEVEIAEATFEFAGDDTYVAPVKDVTDLLGTDALVEMQNQFVSFKDMTVTAVSYKNGEPGDDIYVNLSKNDVEYYFCLEYYLNGSDAEFYDLVGNLEVGAVVDVEGYLYWYEGANPHITSVVIK